MLSTIQAARLKHITAQLIEAEIAYSWRGVEDAAGNEEATKEVEFMRMRYNRFLNLVTNHEPQPILNKG